MTSELRSSLDLHEANFKAMQECDEKAKSEGVLLGRYLAESYADGHAYYKIVKVNKATVRIQVVRGIGDDWFLPCWGEETNIPLSYAKASIERRDTLAKLFSRAGK
jgi:hypothetical protein